MAQAGLMVGWDVLKLLSELPLCTERQISLSLLVRLPEARAVLPFEIA
jgi:hypothetical protein